MRIRSVLVSFLFVMFVLTPVLAAELTVAVAANVQYTFEELKTAFEQETGITVKTVIGSSGKFTAQIENGAPFDVFISADMEYPQTLEKEGLTYNSTKAYAFGTLVLWSLTGVNLSDGVAALKAGMVKKIALPNPKTAPYGRQAVNALKYYNIYVDVQPKLVYGETIAQANQFITTKAVDAGFTSKSTVLAPNMLGRGQWVEIDKEAYEPIEQGIVILKHAGNGNLADAQKLFDFMFTEKAKEIFVKYGYLVP